MKSKPICFLSLFLVLCFVLTGCGGSAGSTVSSAPTVSTVSTAGTREFISLLYSSADTFNPYTLKTEVNRQLCKLLYEPLVKLDNEFNPVNALAQNVTVSGDTCTVTLKNALFSDGTAVTGEDVVYSYKAAKSSSTLYAQKLYEVKDISSSANSITFKLNKTDPYFANLLDFPIIKRDSDKVSNSDSILHPPVGCGRYKLNETQNGLTVNDLFYGAKPGIVSVRLVDAPDAESVSHYAEVGAADIYYTEISDGNVTRIGGRRCDVNLNNLIFIGINKNYSLLAKNQMRQALSAAIDRTKICTEAFYNNAVPAKGFFHPAWKHTSSVQNLQISADEKITVENLKQIGYNKLGTDTLFKNGGGDTIRLTLLVNSDNRLRVLAANTIAAQLKSAGFVITVVEKSYNDYQSCLKNGSFQLFLGEVKLTDNMDISPLVMKDGAVAFGLYSGGTPIDELQKKEKEEKNKNTDSASSVSSASKKNDSKVPLTPSQTVLSEFYEGKNTVSDVDSVLQTDMPFIPVCFRTGALFYSNRIENVNNPSFSDIYFSVDTYKVK